MALPAFITSLAPPKRTQAEKDATLNPLQLLLSLNTMQYLLFLSGFLAWSMDAYDFCESSFQKQSSSEMLRCREVRRCARSEYGAEVDRVGSLSSPIYSDGLGPVRQQCSS